LSDERELFVPGVVVGIAREAFREHDQVIPPAALYLARMRPGSRRVVEGRLRACARLVDPSAVDVIAFPWERLAVAHVGGLTSLVRERFAPATGRAMLVALRGVLRACWQSGAYDWESYERRCDAFARIEGERVRPGRALPPREVSALHRLASDRDRALLAILFGAGCRRSEAAALTWDRFDGEALRILGKGDRERLVPLPGWAVLALRAIRPASVAPGARILRSARGESLSAEGVRFALASLASRAGVAGISPHDARRTFISELLDVADLGAVADLAGHASAEQTRSYDRRGERAGREAVARVRSIIEDG
jgi:integrase